MNTEEKGVGGLQSIQRTKNIGLYFLALLICSHGGSFIYLQLFITGIRSTGVVCE
jgi:hypothetical protein